MYTIKTKEMTVPLKVFSQMGSIEEQCLEQMQKVSTLPFAWHHTALMPDGHFGKGISIGGVLATKGVVVPNAVGVDIGCGMCAVETSLTDIDTDILKKIMGEIRKVIPVGFKKHEKAQSRKLMPSQEHRCYGSMAIVSREYASALKQLGTLGGGNHFIEIQKGSDGHIWIMIHSGSRNLGKQVADHYNKVAIELNKQWRSSVPKEHQLAFLPTGTKQGVNYLKEMQYCVDFALANRKLMMDRIMDIFQKDNVVAFDQMINIAHNYAQMENHFGENVMVHRKGATSAKLDEVGIIPGSQGSKSYIVEGKGNPDSFNSCSHGAGRKMSRSKAKETLDLVEEMKTLDDLRVIHGMRNVGDLDEAAGSYKDINEVMENQKDLVNPVVELTPLAVIKG